MDLVLIREHEEEFSSVLNFLRLAGVNQYCAQSARWPSVVRRDMSHHDMQKLKGI